MLYDKIKEDRNEFRKSSSTKNEYDIATLLRGELDTLIKRNGETDAVDDSVVITVVKKLLKSNNETISLMKDGERKDSLVIQNKYLTTLLPVMMTEEEIRSVLSVGFFSSISEGLKVLDMNNKGLYDRANAVRIIKEMV